MVAKFIMHLLIRENYHLPMLSPTNAANKVVVRSIFMIAFVTNHVKWQIRLQKPPYIRDKASKVHQLNKYFKGSLAIKSKFPQLI